MMCAARIIQRVLNELKPRQTDRVKRLMIGAASVRKGDRFSAQIIERRQPSAEERAHRFVALEINASDFSGAIVEIEICGELFVLILMGELAGRARVGGG